VAFFASFNAYGIPRFMCFIFSLKACICGLFCILSMYMGCALALLIIDITYIKKVNNPLNVPIMIL
jgi:hypothetical protein